MPKFNIVEHACDICVVGGGLAGCMAAIRAGELNERVILVDKSNPQRSGCTATGTDHIWRYFPEIQKAEGVSLDDLVEDHIQNLAKVSSTRRSSTISPPPLTTVFWIWNVSDFRCGMPIRRFRATFGYNISSTAAATPSTSTVAM